MGELTIDFLLHGEGPGTTWAQQAQAGQTVAISHQPGGAYQLDLDADWYLIGGDESALPAIATIIEGLPATCLVRVFTEVADAAEELELDSPARFQVTWLHHFGTTGRIGRKLEQAVRDFNSPPGTVMCGSDARPASCETFAAIY